MRSPLLCLLLLCPTGLLQAQPKDYVEGEVLVTFKESVPAVEARRSLSRHALRLTEQYDELSRARGRATGLIREKSRTTADLIATLKADPSVEIVEPNYLRYVSASTPPNDTHFTKLWGLRNTGQVVNGMASTAGTDTGFITAWKLARPSTQEIVVGVVDTGVEITHPDLAPNIWTNPLEIPGNGVDDDANGYIDDVHGYDFTGNTGRLTDSGDHGTHVAGTIGAVGKNSLGVIGLQFRAKILPLKVSSDGLTMSTSAILAACNYATALKNRGVNIVALNASYGGGSFSTTEQNAITALGNAGIILCAAAGNETADNNTTASYPANYSLANIISVAALTQTNTLANYSNYGSTTVDLGAPGSNIYSTAPIWAVAKTSSITIGSTSYATQELTYSGITSAAGLTRSIYNCGLGNPANFPAGISGNIALIQRGTLTFAEKVTNAKNAGAVAVIIYDNTTAALSAGGFTLGTNTSTWLPTLQVTQASGNAIIATVLPKVGTLINYVDPAQAYQFLNGTSMATPHVSGAVAFAALNFPSETVAQRVSRLLSTVKPVPALAGKTVTGGSLNLVGIVDTDGDGLPDWWETQNFSTLATTATADPDGDGFSNLEEFFTATDPKSSASRLAFSAFSRNAGNFSLTFPTVEDRSYQIEWSPNLLPGSWIPLGSAITGTGNPFQMTDPTPATTAQRRFYRMQVLPE